MKNEEMKVMYDSIAVRRQGLYMVLLTVLTAGVGIALYFIRGNLNYIIFLSLLAAGMLYAGILSYIRSGSCAFVIDGDKIILKGREYEIDEVDFICNITLKGENAKVTGDKTLDEIVNSAPITGLTGDIHVRTEERMYKFSTLADCLTPFSYIAERTDDFVITIWQGKKNSFYKFLGGNYTAFDEYDMVGDRESEGQKAPLPGKDSTPEEEDEKPNE